MKRDFSSTSKQKILGLVNEVEREQFSEFTDWIGDGYYSLQSWIGKLNIRNYLNNVDAYHKKVIDKNNASKETIKRIFSDVAYVDSTYQRNFVSIKSSLQRWDKYIVQMERIVNPGNGNFSGKYIVDSLDGIIKEYSIDELNGRLGRYIELDKENGVYIYHWDEIEELFSKSENEIEKSDYQILIYILNTMIDKKSGYIDTENLQRFINAGYTTPSSVTKDDYHISFEKLPNGDKVEYYYVQNKSYMSDTLKKVAYLYKEMCEKGVIDVPNNDLNYLMQTVVENYSAVEWRRRINLSQDFWSGELYISDEDICNFNEICRTDISIKYCENLGDETGLSFYDIKTNSSNVGEVRTARVEDGMIWRNDPETDNYSDSSIRIYIGCHNANSDLKAAIIKGEVILNRDYQEFDWGSIGKEALEFLAEFIPVGGDIITSGLSIAEQTDAWGQTNAVIGTTKNVDISGLTNISQNTEKKIDVGLSGIGRISGIGTSYYGVIQNNEKVDANKEELTRNNTQFCKLNNLGLRYETMIVRYDHSSYKDGGTGINVDSEKDCAKATSCHIEQKGVKDDPDLLRDQYNTTMYQNTTKNYINDEDFAILEKQIEHYIETGELIPGDMEEETKKYLIKCGLIAEEE